MKLSGIHFHSSPESLRAITEASAASRTVNRIGVSYGAATNCACQPASTAGKFCIKTSSSRLASLRLRALVSFKISVMHGRLAELVKRLHYITKHQANNWLRPASVTGSTTPNAATTTSHARCGSASLSQNVPLARQTPTHCSGTARWPSWRSRITVTLPEASRLAHCRVMEVSSSIGIRCLPVHIRVSIAIIVGSGLR